MIDLEGVTHHPVVEDISEVLCAKTQNTDRQFFRVSIAYFLAKMASNQRAVVHTKDRGEIPINMYALNLATSGYGKGHSVNIIEQEFIRPFREKFVEETMPVIAEKEMNERADKKAIQNQTDHETELEKLHGEYERAGTHPFTFDSGTVPAVKQLRQKLLLANAGSISLQVDEIGSNLESSMELLTLFLEMYDQGQVKSKLTKNTKENIRGNEIDGKTPANVLLFGTPSKLMDGAKTEDMFYSLLETGYARRCLFGVGQAKGRAHHSMTAAEVYARLTKPENKQAVHKWADKFAILGSLAHYGWRVELPDDVAIKLIEYKLACEKAAEELPEHDEIRKAEISHRYFKVLKLAGCYAFVDLATEMEMSHLLQAILLVEESGKAFQKILNREKTYVKLAKYLAQSGKEVTHADLVEALPFYKTGTGARNEMMALATAWGYKKHIIIKKRYVDNIEFFTGETLAETDINNLLLSYSNHFAYEYEPIRIGFTDLPALLKEGGYHWCNHWFTGKHRSKENVLPEFNMLVLDIDGTTRLEYVHELLKEYTFMTQTTKSHTEESHRFRLIIPINYALKMTRDEFKSFMDQIRGWLPFEVDEAVNQAEKKWECNPNAEIFTNMSDETVLLDVLPFIPKTTRNERYQEQMKEIKDMDALERWFAGKMEEGNRNNNMLKYAMALVDSGLVLSDVNQKVLSFNSKLSNSLDEAEIHSTILKTVARRYLA